MLSSEESHCPVNSKGKRCNKKKCADDAACKFSKYGEYDKEYSCDINQKVTSIISRNTSYKIIRNLSFVLSGRHPL